jgi:hypothetical protein
MVDQIARAIAKADGAEFKDDPGRFLATSVACDLASLHHLT